jgi:integrase
MPRRLKHDKRNLTVRYIDSITPPAKGRDIYWDAGIPGFGLRITAAGGKSWVLVYTLRGVAGLKWTIGSYPKVPLADAREKAWEGLGKVAKGVDPAVEKRVERERDTFKEMAEDYIERHAKPNKRSWKQDRLALDRDLLPAFGNRKAAEVRRRDVIDLLDGIKARGATVMANRTLEIIRRIYNWGIQKERLTINPCIGIPPFPEQARDRVLSEAELRAVWHALDKQPALVAARYRLLILTAQRSGEVRQMKWADVPDIDSGWWTIPAELAKNGLSHRVWLPLMAQEILHSIRRTGGGGLWIFPAAAGAGAVSHGYRTLGKIKRSSGVDFRPHDLRRTVASHMASMGVSRFTIGRVLNHIETSVTATYDRHSYDAEKRQALETWAKRLEEIIAGEKHADSKVVALRPAAG